MNGVIGSIDLLNHAPYNDCKMKASVVQIKQHETYKFQNITRLCSLVTSVRATLKSMGRELGAWTEGGRPSPVHIWPSPGASGFVNW